MKTSRFLALCIIAVILYVGIDLYGVDWALREWKPDSNRHSLLP